jgi:hypothetical protein
MQQKWYFVDLWVLTRVKQGGKSTAHVCMNACATGVEAVPKFQIGM